jgi:hypothetical protein
MMMVMVWWPWWQNTHSSWTFTAITRSIHSSVKQNPVPGLDTTSLLFKKFSLGKNEWRAPKTFLHIFWNFLWICNYLQIKS